MFFELLAVAASVGVAGDVYDVTMTEKGLKAGIAVEANDWLVGSKPSAVSLYLRDGLVFAMCVIPAVVFAAVAHNVPLGYGALVAPVVFGVKHILGGLQWRKLLKGGKLSTMPQSAWQKFLDF